MAGGIERNAPEIQPKRVDLYEKRGEDLPAVVFYRISTFFSIHTAGEGGFKCASVGQTLEPSYSRGERHTGEKISHHSWVCESWEQFVC